MSPFYSLTSNQQPIRDWAVKIWRDIGLSIHDDPFANVGIQELMLNK